MIKFCKKCQEEKNDKCLSGYSFWWKDSVTICPNCGGELIDIDFPAKDLAVIEEISEDVSFIEAMIKLRETDIIDYNLKMSQFRTQVEQQNQAKQQTDNTPHCPKCGSTQITTGARGVNHFWGFIGASKTVNRCGNCGHTWTPKG